MEKRFLIFVTLIAVIGAVFGIEFSSEKNEFEIYLDKSGPYIGTGVSTQSGFDGDSIRIAVIDTGVDYNHPDLMGFGPDGKVVGGYDFVDNDKSPLDTNGHGTEVAGIIAADGNLKGVAPKSEILAYRVSDDGDAVSSELIIKAIERSIADDADIINISLGINKTNKRIDEAVNRAVENGIVVIAAAGNSGPESSTIGSPGINPNAITVGATYNNVSSSLVSTLEIGGEQFQVLPMVGTDRLDEPISAQILFGKYGRERDLDGVNVENSILLVERGSDVEDEIVYFSTKESNAASAGAKAIIVYNNKPGFFLGELVHELAGPNYTPRIPALSLSQEEGLKITNLLENKTVGTLNIFYNPDFVAYFSSRGPVSPFYIKPDLVAPGAFINTTLTEGKYNFTSGTSFAAPHVTGAAAILLQKNGNLEPSEVKSLLVTTADPVSDAYGTKFPFEVGGTGRVNVTKAFQSDLIVLPTNLIFNLSPENLEQEKSLALKSLGNDLNVDVSFDKSDVIDFDHKLENKTLYITASIREESFGQFSNTLLLEQNGITHSIPILTYITKGSVMIDEQEGKLNFGVTYPDNWSYAKISVINSETGKFDTTSSTPSRDGSLSVDEPGLYWVEAKIRSNGQTFDVYDVVEVTSVSNTNELNVFGNLNIPGKPIILVFAIVAIIALVGLKIKR